MAQCNLANCVSRVKAVLSLFILDKGLGSFDVPLMVVFGSLITTVAVGRCSVSGRQDAQLEQPYNTEVNA